MMVTRDERVVILDFGLVIDIDDRALEPAGAIYGSAAYMSPEQAAGAKLTPASDWY